MNIGLWYEKNRRDIWICVVLFLIAVFPRMLDLGTFLTADEKNWIGRSYEFIRAFKDLRFNDMLQTTHPGVTTLWLSGVSITAEIILKHIPFSFRNLIHFIAASQAPIALANALAIPAIYCLLRIILNKRIIPFVAASLIALDPFIIGYSRVIHVDALLASFMMLACLSIIIYVQKGYSRVWLLISAVFSSLAILTKAPAIFVIPFFLLSVLISDWHVINTKELLKLRSRDFLEWLLVILTLFIIIWPAIIWVPNPEGNVLLLKRDIGEAAVTPHDTNEEYSLNAWHYPAALVTRLTPTTQLFSLIFLGWFLFGQLRKQNSNMKNTKEYWLFISYIVFFLIMMTLGAKKGDRYIMPVFPMFDVMAALGIAVTTVAITKKIASYTFQQIVWPISGVVGLMLLGSVIHYHPYEIAYSNPLFPDNLSQELGWGEGLDQVAAWLNINAPRSVVASWYPEELGAFTSARVAHINAHEQGQVRYIVLYKNMFGRAPDNPANDFIDEYYKKRNPVFVAHIVGKEFAWVFPKQVYERVVGELTPDRVISQEIPVTVDKPVGGVELLVATYSGKATEGNINVVMTEKSSGEVIGTWQRSIEDIEDNRWLRLPLSEGRLLERKSVVVTVTTTGTAAENAPTVRYTDAYKYRTTDMILDGEEKRGDLAIRLLYSLPNNQFASEEDTKLISL